jgi:glycosyltransferase involved in cell wall biosynthesis
LPETNPLDSRNFHSKNNPQNHHPIIGIAARFASEKGVEVLISSMEKITKELPQAGVWFAGPYKNILGEEDYYQNLQPKINELEKKGNWKFLGLLNPGEMAAFYKNIDMLTIPSLNSTEAFGLVQIEAMMNGKPSIASDLPGVRQPVLRHKMGRVIPIGDADALANSIIEIWKKGNTLSSNADLLRERYSPDLIAAQFEALFDEIKEKNK